MSLWVEVIEGEEGKHIKTQKCRNPLLGPSDHFYRLVWFLSCADELLLSRNFPLYLFWESHCPLIQDSFLNSMTWVPNTARPLPPAIVFSLSTLIDNLAWLGILTCTSFRMYWLLMLIFWSSNLFYFWDSVETVSQFCIPKLLWNSMSHITFLIFKDSLFCIPSCGYFLSEDFNYRFFPFPLLHLLNFYWIICFVCSFGFCPAF